MKGVNEAKVTGARSGVVVITILLLAAGVMTACKSSPAASADAHAAQPQAAQTSDFGMEQNDTEGYNKIPWGTALADFDKIQKSAATTISANNSPFVSNVSATSSSYEPSMTNSFVGEEPRMFAKAFGVPSDGRQLMGIDISNPNWSLVPNKFQAVKKDDVEYEFYNGKFVMAFSHLDAHNYEAIRSNIASKYSVIDTVSDGWAMQQLEENPDKMEVQGEVFKRGNTNTRIFLIRMIEHTGIGMDSTSLYLAYIPNSYFQAIRSDIARNASNAQAEARAKQAQKQQPDMQKIQ